MMVVGGCGELVHYVVVLSLSFLLRYPVVNSYFSLLSVKSVLPCLNDDYQVIS
jgi:hypothetical protein